MRKRFLLKLSLRTLDQLKALILVCPCGDNNNESTFNQAFKRNNHLTQPNYSQSHPQGLNIHL